MVLRIRCIGGSAAGRLPCLVWGHLHWRRKDVGLIRDLTGGRGIRPIRKRRGKRRGESEMLPRAPCVGLHEVGEVAQQIMKVVVESALVASFTVVPRVLLVRVALVPDAKRFKFEPEVGEGEGVEVVGFGFRGHGFGVINEAFHHLKDSWAVAVAVHALGETLCHSEQL